MTSKPKLKVDEEKLSNNKTMLTFTCVEKCPSSYIEVVNRCLTTGAETEFDLSEFFNKVTKDLLIVWPQILVACFVAMAFSYVVLVLFRYAIEYIIWIIYIGFVSAFGIGAIYFLYLFATTDDEDSKIAALTFAIILILIMAIFIVLFLWFRKRIKLVAQLFKEASKSLIDVPAILFEPILTFVALLLAIAPYIFFLMLIGTAGDPVNQKKPNGDPQIIFQPDFGVVLAQFLNTVAFIWFTQFIFGCQHFVIAGEKN